MLEENLNMLALLPCAMKIPMERELSRKISEVMQGEKNQLKYKILSNAVMEKSVFNSVRDSKTAEQLPDIMLAPGFTRFFYPSFVEQFRSKGLFQSVCSFTMSEVYREKEINDPEGYYDIIAFNPLIFLVDRTNAPDLPVPTCWDDLLDPVYENKVAFRGRDERSYCEGILLTVYQEKGIEGIEKLARTVKCRLHPAQMVKFAGSRSPEAPCISVIPLSFALLVKETANVQVVWPKDGAAVNPIVMLVKKDSREKVKEIARFLASEQAGEIFQRGGFYSIRSNLKNAMPRSGEYKWLGWEFLKNQNLGVLLEELNGIMHRVVSERMG